MDAKKELFGFLRYSKLIKFKGGEISITDDYENACNWIEKISHEDGFIYPPLSHRVKIDPITGKDKGKIPKTERPSLLHKLPVTHQIIIEQPVSDQEIRISDAAFVVHLLSFIFGTRLQFKDWWFDSRVPTRPTLNIYIRHSTVEDFISIAYQTWETWEEQKRKWFNNILVMFSKAPSYEWDWERFTIEYMVFDGLFKLAEMLFGCTAKSHKKRFEALCNIFGIPFNEELIERIYTLRNDLFHQTLWNNGQPGTVNANSNAFYQPYHLRRFNSRLIPAILGYQTPYIKTGWWYMETIAFEKIEANNPLEINAQQRVSVQ